MIKKLLLILVLLFISIVSFSDDKNIPGKIPGEEKLNDDRPVNEEQEEASNEEAEDEDEEDTENKEDELDSEDDKKKEDIEDEINRNNDKSKTDVDTEDEKTEEKVIHTYKLALLLPVTGKDSLIGNSIAEGIKTFYKYFIKDTNGEYLSFFKINITIFDTESKPENAEKIIEHLSKNSDEYLVISGGTNKEEALSLLELAERNKIPYLFPFNISFKEKLRQYYFPLMPSLYSGFKYALKYFKNLKIEAKIIYDDKTKEDAFILNESKNLIEFGSKDFEKNLSKASIIFVSDENVEKVLKAIGTKSLKVLNFHQMQLPTISKETALWEGVLFLNWVKGNDFDQVQFFKEEFSKINKDIMINNYHMLGWILGDFFYENLNESYQNQENGEKVTRDNFIKQIESINKNGGYDDGCGYKIFYSPFSLLEEKSRAGISGMYFMEYKKENFVIITNFESIFE